MSDQEQTKSQEIQQQKKHSQSAIVSAISGIFCTSIGKIFVHPIDTVKAKLQVQKREFDFQSNLKSRSLILQIAKDTLKKEGIKGLYRGFGISVVGAVPAGGLYFGSYELFKNNTLQYQYFQDHPFISYLAGGMFAEAISCIFFVPIDVIKERRQVQIDLNKYYYKNDIDAIKQIKNTEGLRGLYRAYGATVMSFGPFSAFYFLFYENLKGLLVQNDPETYLKKVNQQEEKDKPKAAHVQDIGFFQSMFCSMMAGGLASILTNPLDMAKLRLQVQRAGANLKTDAKTNDFYYKNLLDAIHKIVKNEGVKSLFNGSLARIVYHVPMVAISMSILEHIKPKIQKYLDSE